MRVGYRRLTDRDDLVPRLREFAPRTVVFDIEPLVARWDTDHASLEAGVWKVIDSIAIDVPGVQVVAFATNSRRRLTMAESFGTVRLMYLAAAAKPFRAAPYRHLPLPGLMVGDQVATDGVLAWRLGFAFSPCAATSCIDPSRSTDHESPRPPATTLPVQAKRMTYPARTIRRKHLCLTRSV